MASDNITALIDGPKKFIRRSVTLIKRCHKPDQREFQRVAQAVGIGFLMMGFLGYFVKLVHIPINNIIVGA